MSRPFNLQLLLTYLTTRLEGDIVRGQLIFSEICDGRGGAGVYMETGDEAAEVAGAVNEWERKKDTISHLTM